MASQKPQENSLTNPKRTTARREAEAEGTTKAAPEKKGDMTQSAFSGYGKPKDKAKDKAGLEKALKNRK